MSHVDTLRGMASDERILAGRENARSTALLAGVDALEAIGRVRHALSGIARVRADYEAYLLRYNDHAEWYGATSDAFEYVIHLLTEALEGETE